MTAYDMAMQYYPRLWDKSRLEQLADAGRLTREEMDRIVKEAAKRDEA